MVIANLASSKPCHNFYLSLLYIKNNCNLYNFSKRYEAEIDQGHAFRCCQPWLAIMCLPKLWMYAAARGCGQILSGCSCDEVVCWVRKEYSERMFFRVYPNRIEFNIPQMRIPFGFLACGSWNADYIVTNVSFSWSIFALQKCMFD